MSAENELKWMTKRYSWRYIPFRYQAMVATIVSAFLYYNLFEILFSNNESSGVACGTLLRPILTTESGSDPVGWFWNSSPFSLDVVARCPRTLNSLWWELLASFVALAICGLVMRRAIKRENANG
jgi:hypothetical protein